MAGKRSGAFMAGAILGVAAGAIAGLVSAPRTGKETRRMLKKTADALPDIAEDLSSSVQIHADRLSETALEKWDVTLFRLKEAVVAGVDATRQAQQAQSKEAAAENNSQQHTDATDDRFSVGEVD